MQKFESVVLKEKIKNEIIDLENKDLESIIEFIKRIKNFKKDNIKLNVINKIFEELEKMIYNSEYYYKLLKVFEYKKNELKLDDDIKEKIYKSLENQDAKEVFHNFHIILTNESESKKIINLWISKGYGYGYENDGFFSITNWIKNQNNFKEFLIPYFKNFFLPLEIKNKIIEDVLNKLFENKNKFTSLKDLIKYIIKNGDNEIFDTKISKKYRLETEENIENETYRTFKDFFHLEKLQIIDENIELYKKLPTSYQLKEEKVFVEIKFAKYNKNRIDYNVGSCKFIINFADNFKIIGDKVEEIKINSENNEIENVDSDDEFENLNFPTIII